MTKGINYLRCEAMSPREDRAAIEPVPPPFVSVAWLRARLAEGDEHAPVVVDARAEAAYLEGHLPGAVPLPARELNAPVAGVRRLVPAERLAELGARLGLGAGTVVVVGSRGGADAAHVGWTLHAHGHPDARLLDGGVEAWRTAGGPLEPGPPAPRPARERFVPRLEPGRLIAADELRARLGDPDLLVLDTRAPEEYRGELVAARRGGHLPGARLFEWTEALEPDGRLRATARLRELLAEALAAPEVALYCQSGVRAAHTYAVLRALGHDGARLYLGSWAEWGDRDDWPVAVPEGEER